LGAISTSGGYISSTEQIADGVLENGGTYTTIATNPLVVGAGTWTLTYDGAYWGNYFFGNSTNANGDNVSFSTALPAGIYKLQIFCPASYWNPIIDVYIDADKIAAIDTYLSSGNQAKTFEETGIAVATGGVKTIKFTINGKNASASTYRFRMYAFSFIRTG